MTIINHPRTNLHQLTLWRESQFYLDPRTRERRTMRKADAAREFGVALAVWTPWETPESEGGKIPTRENMVKLYEFTRGHVRPDHFYELPTLRLDRFGPAAVGDDGAPLSGGAATGAEDVAA